MTSNGLGSFSLRETMRKLNQPYIDWSDGILSTGYLPIDRQHHWLLTIVNISFVIIVVEPWWYIIIHISMGNQVNIHIADVIDALSDYAWIHFTEEEELFMNNEYPFWSLDLHFLTYNKYPQGAIHKKQHEVMITRNEWIIGVFVKTWGV